MRVAQICHGRFHHFDLACQLNRRGLLARFYTGYPRSKLRHSGIPPDLVAVHPWIMAPFMGLNRYGAPPWLLKEMLWRALESVDRFAARHLVDSDVVIAISSSGLHTGRTAKSRGARFVCDRGSSHIRYQEAILREEFARWGEAFSGIDPRVRAKEEAEYALADAITVPSTFVARSFIEQGIPATNLRQIPYGVDLSRFSKVADPDKDRFDVLFVGQVSFRKGVPDLIHAFRRVRHPNKRLKLVGMLQPEMRRWFHSNPPQADIEIVGHVPQVGLKTIMSRAHVMVLPSIEEGLALVLAQALACGCPVIASAHTGAEDLFRDGIEGFVVPIRDPVMLTQRLQQLIDDPEKRLEMGVSALQRVTELGGWEDYGTRVAAMLAGLVGCTLPRPLGSEVT